MTYTQAVEKINSLLVFGSRPGLERIREMVDRMGAPDRSLKFVHIAGTNGKGSTCAMIASALKEAGYKTGLFISPYVLEFRERFSINGEMIPESELSEIVEELFPLVEEMKSEDKVITEFEFVLAIALRWFEREKCDIVVLETGLGGRFDATNIIDTPLASVITSISLDHTAILGDTVEKIAFEKAGIIKPDGTTVLYADQPSGALKVLSDIAEERRNKIFLADASKAEIKKYDISGTVFEFETAEKKWEISISLCGEHQVKNCVTALYTLIALRDKGINIPDNAVTEGFKKVSFSARMEIFSKEPLILLDGAHNPGGAKALSEALKKYIPSKKKIGIVGMLADKDIKTALGELLPLFDTIYTVAPPNPRRMTAEDLCSLIKPICKNVSACKSAEEAFELALSSTKPEDALVVFGSLYLASEMRPIIIEKLNAK